MARNLRDWLGELDEHQLLNKVTEPVHIGTLATTIAEFDHQATLFENIRGYQMPVAANTFSNRAMMALALGAPEDRLLDTLAERMAAPMDPVMVKDAPCKEVIETGSEVNLAALPLHLQHELDGAPYITASVLVARDPSRDVHNLGIYRMMYRTPRETGVDVTAPHKLRHYFEQACELERPLEVAAVVGLPAIDMLASLASTPLDVDEYGTLGGFRGEPAELIKCETVDLLVPANAEMVLEGEMLPIGWSEDEGPYGEFTGTYGGSMKSNPTIRIKAITRRRDAMLQSATHGGRRPGWTDMHAFFPMLELSLYNALNQAGIQVVAVRALPASSGMWAAASIKPLSMGDARTALAILMSASKQAFPKFAVVVDPDIDIFDDEQLTWAMTWRSQPHKDLMVLEDMKAVPLDPSLATSMPPVTTSKMGLDATIPVDRNQDDFAICLPASFGPDHGDGTAPGPDELDALMLDFIKAGPVHFQDIITRFGGETYQAALEALARLREQGALTRDEAGRYMAR